MGGLRKLKAASIEGNLIRKSVKSVRSVQLLGRNQIIDRSEVRRIAGMFLQVIPEGRPPSRTTNRPPTQFNQAGLQTPTKRAPPSRTPQIPTHFQNRSHEKIRSPQLAAPKFEASKHYFDVAAVVPSRAIILSP